MLSSHLWKSCTFARNPSQPQILSSRSQFCRGITAIYLVSASIYLVSASACWAGGTVALDDVLALPNSPSALKDEVSAQLTSANLSAPAVICQATRIARHWRNLGGER